MPQVSIGRPVSAIGVETTTRFSLINGWRWRPNRESRTRYRRRRFRGRCWIMAAMNICAPTTASQLASSYRRVANGTHLPSIFGCFFFRPLLFLASFLSLFLPCFCPPLFSFFFPPEFTRNLILFRANDPLCILMGFAESFRENGPLFSLSARMSLEISFLDRITHFDLICKERLSVRYIWRKKSVP